MTPSERKQTEFTRSKALVNGLSGYLGRPSAHLFAVAYDLATGSNTVDDKRWRLFFQGRQALSPKGVEKLAAVFPAFPVQRMYRDGPGGLWQALWGELGEFSRGVLAADLASFGDFSQAMYEFEADTLLMDAYGLLEPELTVGHLAKAVAYSRLQSGLLGLDSSGMALVIRRCMASRIVRAELGMYDVLDEVLDALEPLASTEEPSTLQRWDAVAARGRLAWLPA
jgi:hypothetical protein